MTAPGKVRPGGLTLAALSLAMLLAPSAVPRAARAQETPPAANAAPSVVTPGPAPGNEPPAAPPPGQPGPPPPEQPAPPPPGQGYPPGYGPPGYPPGYAQPGYPPGYAPPGYPPGYAPPGYAPPAPAEPTHTGTYVHLHLGGGFTSIRGSDGNGGTLKLSGGGPSLAVAVGGAVAPNLVLFGNIFFTMASQPQVSSNGSYYTAQSSGDAFIGGFGGGIAYYFMPANVYISAVLATTQFEADDSNGKTTYTTDYGVGFEGMIGKEFWVSDHWGLGAALEFIGASSMKDHDIPSITWSAGAFNVVFSATYF